MLVFFFLISMNSTMLIIFSNLAIIHMHSYIKIYFVFSITFCTPTTVVLTEPLLDSDMVFHSRN